MYRKGAYPTSKINKIFKHLYYQQQNLNDHEPETRSHLLPIRYSDLIQQLLNNNISLIMKLANKVYCHLVTWNTSISSICNSRTKLKQKTSFSYLWRRWHAANMVATTPDFPNSRRSLIFEPSSCQISSIYSNIKWANEGIYIERTQVCEIYRKFEQQTQQLAYVAVCEKCLLQFLQRACNNKIRTFY